MAIRNKLYNLNAGDRAIIDKMRETGNPNFFTKFYLKSPSSGTWWRPFATTESWAKGYEFLFSEWKRNSEAERFAVEQRGALNQYATVWEDDLTYPSFHNHHGWLFQPWQLRCYQRDQRVLILVAGFGAGKTIYGVVSNLVRAATIPGYQGLFLAPNSNQTTDAYNQALQLMYETEFANRFLVKAVEKPFPKIYIGNDVVGKNIIHFFPIGDAVGSAKVLSLRVDTAFIDQAESLDDLAEIMRNTGSRMVGQYKGRPRLGRIDFSANANESQELWELYDSAETNPKRVMAMTASTWDNPFITDEQLAEVREDVGSDAESIRVHMGGGRPLGGGEHFSLKTLNAMVDPTLDDMMAKCREEDIKGHVYSETRKVGIYEWQLPYETDHNYLVITDPGWANPPHRNAPALLVWDYTDFPAIPARLVAFYWVFGHNNPMPWIVKHTELVDYYRAQFSNAIDATGQQAGYEKLVSKLKQVNVQGMSLTAGSKPRYLNWAKTMAANGYLRVPSIPGIYGQLSKYRLPDDHIAQDIVMAFILSAGWLETIFHVVGNDESFTKESEGNLSEDDRYWRNDELDRYGRDFVTGYN